MHSPTLHQLSVALSQPSEQLFCTQETLGRYVYALNGGLFWDSVTNPRAVTDS